MKFFRPEHFANEGVVTPEYAADKANAKLEREGVRVYGAIDSGIMEFYNHSDKQYTHQALLFCIEELKPKECEHEPHRTTNDLPAMNEQRTDKEHAICYKCSAKIKPKWEKAE